MALFDSNNDDRTEQASAFRREEFRKQGKVALSRELVSVAMLLLVGGALYYSGAHLLEQFGAVTKTFFRFDKMGVLGKNDLVTYTQVIVKAWAWACAPVFAVGFVTAVGAAAAQVGFHVTWEPLTPNWERINPVAGFGRLFSGKSVMEAAKGLVKLGVGGWLLWTFMKGLEPVVGTLFRRDVSEGLLLSIQLVGKMFLWLVAAFSVLAILDFSYQRWTMEKEMRMTKREAKDEFKLREGDPLIKARVRSMQRQIANRRMMKDVPKADVVVTNPTHFAVALKYDPTQMSAPKVVAKGADNIAKRIREIAKENRVPIVENKPLARTLFRDIDVGGYVPKELYKAVAQVLSYVYRLKGRTSVS
jgi:flagellar biosynthesis protein FlhB